MGLFDGIASYFKKDGFVNLSADERVGRIDAGARRVLAALEAAGFEAYVVGGCVRDLSMGKAPHDWDITTSARPEDTLRVAASHGWQAVDGGGRRFGTVILVVDREGQLYDFFGGMEDMKAKKLCTVGNAAERFSEDALRLFRACRFLGQLDFLADSSLVDGMASAFPRVAGLSLERVRSEVDRLIVTDHAARGFDLMVRTGLSDQSCRVKEKGVYREIPILTELSHLVDLPQQKEFHKFDGWYHTLAVLEASSPILLNRWAALLHDVAKGLPGIRAVRKGRLTDYGHDKKGAEMSLEILQRWGRSPDFTRRVAWLVENHMRFHFFANSPDADTEKWVRQMARDKVFPSSAAMAEGILQMTDLCKADIIGCGRPLSATEGHEAFGRYMADLAKAMPVTHKELRYDKEVPRLLAPDVAAGMQNLLTRVQNGTLENTEEAIHQAAVRYHKRHG